MHIVRYYRANGTLVDTPSAKFGETDAELQSLRTNRANLLEPNPTFSWQHGHLEIHSRMTKSQELPKDLRHPKTDMYQRTQNKYYRDLPILPSFQAFGKHMDSFVCMVVDVDTPCCTSSADETRRVISREMNRITKYILIKTNKSIFNKTINKTTEAKKNKY